MAAGSGSFSALVTTATSTTATSTTTAAATAAATTSATTAKTTTVTATPTREWGDRPQKQYDPKPRWNSGQKGLNSGQKAHKPRLSSNNEEEQKSVKPNGQQTPPENREKSFDNPRY